MSSGQGHHMYVYLYVRSDVFVFGYIRWQELWEPTKPRKLVSREAKFHSDLTRMCTAPGSHMYVLMYAPMHVWLFVFGYRLAY